MPYDMCRLDAPEADPRHTYRNRSGGNADYPADDGRDGDTGEERRGAAGLARRQSGRRQVRMPGLRTP